MRSRGQIWGLFSKRFRRFQSRPFCTNKPSNANNKNGTNIIIKEEANVADEASSSSISRQDAYKELENLNFMTAAKILFTTPPKNKKFGLDFHLVQLFFACLPSLAVYLVAQYARSEMRRMDAELEVKKKAEEEAKATEKAAEEQEMTSDPQLLAVKVRLDKLEETVKEIVVESKKKSADPRDKGQVDDGGRKQPTMVKPNNSAGDASSSNAAKGSPSKEAGEGRTPSTALTDASRGDQKSSKNYEPSSDVKK
ncbi:uncharacterized protein [Coffea arabica]|uniref:Uncharacterized protein isoform X1 n=1 Tax=Coffea arabica TaxID=13443 RepID=A0A6P6XGA8_COFAR|nr:uncharacterized protein LOC113741674 isoform X1 [Coffea arabica]